MTAEAIETFALPPALVAGGFALRAENEADVPFLCWLYATTRADELAPIADWSLEQKLAFLQSQFDLQRRHYYSHFPHCRFLVLEHQGEPVGRLYLDMAPGSLDIIDIALLPQLRGKGTGGAIIREVMALAAASGRYVGIWVEKFNPALNLYRRLGFQEVTDQDVHLEMHWRP